MQRKIQPIRGRAKPKDALHEWVGGRLTVPFYVTEPEPFRPDAIIWYETPQDLILAVDLVEPGKPVSFGESLLEVMRAPKAGAPRRPQSIRVSDAQLAAEIRAVAGDIPIRVAPTPELERLLEMFVEQNPESEAASYLEGGRIPPESIASLFSAARYLWTIAPWKTIYDGQVIRLDVPKYDVRGAAISIIGNREESFGFLVFPSTAGYEAFERFAEKHDGGERFDFGTTVLSLDYGPGADLPAPMRREVARHKWPVAGPDAYPVAVHRDHDGLQRPLLQREVDLLAATAMALGTFYTKNEAILRHEVKEPVSMTISDENDVDVRFTYPYEAFALFSEERLPRRSAAPARRSSARTRDAIVPQPSLPLFTEPPRPAARVAKVGRNDPCPCGSGKKYKKCHLETDEESRSVAPSRIHEHDERLVARLRRYATRRFGAAFERVEDDFLFPEATLQLLLPWSVFHFEIEGRPIVAWFMEEKGAELTHAERAWLETQSRAWLSVWEVQRVEPGRGVEVVDMLSGARRFVLEVSGSRTMSKLAAVLGRIAEDHQSFVFVGAHPRLLPPEEAAEVVGRARKRLRLRGDVPVERLLNEPFGRFLITQWEETITDLDFRATIPPRLQNTDGDEIMMIVDRYTFPADTRGEIATRLASMEGVEAPEEEETDTQSESEFVFVRQGNAKFSTWENTILGRAVLGGQTLLLETNSKRRAKDLRRTVEKACKGWIHHDSREVSDVEELMARTATDDNEADEPMSDDLARELRERKQEFYSRWLDEAIPALDGRTPREAARLVRGRKDLDVLLKGMEHREARLPEHERVDFERLRAELGLRS